MITNTDNQSHTHDYKYNTNVFPFDDKKTPDLYITPVAKIVAPVH